MKDDSSNSIILIGKRANIEKLKSYIRKLDVTGEDEDMQRMYVIPLKNSNVEDMEKILSKIVPQMTDNVSMGSINAVTKGAKVPVQRATRTSTNRNKKVKKAVIASDLERNALVVLANSAQIKNIRDTIKALDIEKPQVYIKAKIVEVNTNLANQIGVKYGFNGGSITSKGLFSLLASSGAEPLELSGDLLSFVNQGGTRTIYNRSRKSYWNRRTTNNFEFEEGIKQIFSIGLKLDLLRQNGCSTDIIRTIYIMYQLIRVNYILWGRLNLLLKNFFNRSTQGKPSNYFSQLPIVERIYGNYFLKGLGPRLS